MEGTQPVPLDYYFSQLSQALSPNQDNNTSPSESMETCEPTSTSTSKPQSEDDKQDYGVERVDAAEVAATKGLLGLGGGDRMEFESPPKLPKLSDPSELSDPSSSSSSEMAGLPYQLPVPFVFPPQCFLTTPALKRAQQVYSRRSWQRKRTVQQNSLVAWYPRVMTWQSHLIHIPKDFDPLQEFFITSTSGAKLAHYLPKAFPKKEAQEAYEATTELESVVHPKWRHNTRTEDRKAIQFHYGQWRRSTKVQETKEHTGDTKDHMKAVQRWAERLQPLCNTVKKLLRAKVPQFAKFLEALSVQQTWSFGGFSVCSVNFNYGGLSEHTDEKDHHDAYCVVVPLGNYQGGELCFRFAENVVVIPVQQGDAVIMQGANIHHFVQEYSGDRYSLVLHTCHCLVRDMVPNVAKAYQC